MHSASESYDVTSKDLIIYMLSGVSEREMREEETETIFEGIMAENFPNTTKTINTQIRDLSPHQTRET